MAKKKNPQKKHKFKHVEGQVPVRDQAVAVESGVKESVAVAKPAVVGRDFSYVASDLGRIGVMAGSLIAIELILYYLLVHTSFGTSIYNLVKV